MQIDNSMIYMKYLLTHEDTMMSRSRRKKNNIIIAKFLNWYISDDKERIGAPGNYETKPVLDFDFHYNGDLLFELIERIQDLDIVLDFDISKTECTIYTNEFKFDDVKVGFNDESYYRYRIYKACVIFILHYFVYYGTDNQKRFAEDYMDDFIYEE